MQLTRLCMLALALAACAVHVQAAVDDSTLAKILQFMGLRRADKEVFEPQQQLLIVGAGMAKTGTSSLQVALAKLGFKAYHMREVMSSDHTEMIRAAALAADPALKKKAVDAWFADILKRGYNATVDLPTAGYYKEQLEMFPNAKVILSLREPNAWYKSYDKMMSRVKMFSALKYFPMPQLQKLVRFLDDTTGSTSRNGPGASGCQTKISALPTHRPWFAPWVAFPYNPNPSKDHVSGFLHKDKCIKYFNDHNEEVRRVVPKEQLLEYYVSDGWEPLCKFLGVPVPDIPFPVANKAEEFDDVESLVVAMAYVWPLAYILPAAALFGTGRFVVRRLLALNKAKLS